MNLCTSVDSCTDFCAVGSICMCDLVLAMYISSIPLQALLRRWALSPRIIEGCKIINVAATRVGKFAIKHRNFIWAPWMLRTVTFYMGHMLSWFSSTSFCYLMIGTHILIGELILTGYPVCIHSFWQYWCPPLHIWWVCASIPWQGSKFWSVFFRIRMFSCFTFP
jgi:hypothetical protein